MAPENSMACNILHVYTSWSCSRLCLWWIGKFHIWVAKPPDSVTMILFLVKIAASFVFVCEGGFGCPYLAYKNLPCVLHNVD